MKPHVLVIDDELNIRKSLEMILSGLGFSVHAVGTAEEGLDVIAQQAVGLVFLDLQLPGMDGLEMLQRLRAHDATLPVVMISGHATVEKAVEATRLGAFEFVEKPFSRDRIVVLARNATESQQLHAENRRLRQQSDDELLGESSVVHEMRRIIEQVAPTDARVLIRGESGTGKELVAKAIHRSSRRAGKPFVRVNCAAIPEELIEAELFGAVKGAYTGSVSDRAGRFAAADGGTLLLDEIGDMSAKAQVRVLRVLQEGEFERVGSTETESVDVRVLAATHQDLEARVKEGLFREDLMYRLNVVPVSVPPLRQRGDDVGLLIGHFLEAYAGHHGLEPPRLNAEARKLLQAYNWPGNIRELKNVVERLVILHHGCDISGSDLPAELTGAAREVRGTANPDSMDNPYVHLPLREARDALERDLIRSALKRHVGNVTQAAKDLGLERTHLHKRIKAMDIQPTSDKGDT